MKTKLLFLLLFAFSFANAQINVSEGFESGLAPAGWTSEGYINTTPTINDACNGSYKLRSSSFMLGSNAYSAIYTSGYISNGNSISASFNYKGYSYTATGNVYFFYELNNSGTWNLLASSSAITTSCLTLSGTIAAGIIPSGSTVRFRMQMNSYDNLAFFDDFSVIQTGSSPTPQILADYTFDNTYFNTSGTLPFANIPGTTSFVADRNGVVNNAIQVVGDSNNGTFSSLFAPTGASNRTISFWYKTVSHAGFKSLFSYGAAAPYQTFGAYFGANGNIVLQGYAYDYDFGGSYALNTWRHLVITLDGTNASLYMNGTLIQTVSRPLLNTGVGTSFRIGNNGVTMQFDDLKIYNTALSQTEITNLYTNNTLSSSNFSQNNLEVSLYPNPVRDILNIEIKNDIQSIEIYNIQGQKVLSSNQKQINVSDLAAGMYMVRIQDVEKNITTKKIVIK